LTKQPCLANRMSGGTSYSLVQALAVGCITLHFVTNRQTDDSIMPIAGRASCSSKIS